MSKMKPRRFQVGSQPPKGYIARQTWAEIQHKAGLRQTRCGLCGLFHFPQEKCD